MECSFVIFEFLYFTIIKRKKNLSRSLFYEGENNEPASENCQDVDNKKNV